MDFLRKVYSSQYSPSVVEHLLQRLRSPTNHQYEVTWPNFSKFVNLHRFKEMSIPFVLEYFASMFKDNYGVATIWTAKSALSKPLEECFDLDLSEEVFRDLSRLFSLQRQAKWPKAISWSLDKVLDLFKYQLYSGPSCSIELLLKKAIFLISLASGNEELARSLH